MDLPEKIKCLDFRKYFDIPAIFYTMRKLFSDDHLRRDGRVVECTGLENRQDASPPGFESLFLRHIFR